ncbi:MAG: iron ABC transporter permease [Eubacteriales bacterium]
MINNGILKNIAKKRILTILISILILFVVCIISIMLGSTKFTVVETLSVFTNSITEDALANQIIMNIRIPRLITGMFVGMNLGVAGVLLQGILRNPMASPNIIGVNAGAGFGAIIAMTILPQFASSVPIFAFLGALSATITIYLLSCQNSAKSNPVYIVLAGIAVSNLLSALTSALMALNTDALDITYSWLLGSLSGRTWSSVSIIIPYSIVGLTLALMISPKINIFGLGDEVASSLGVSVSIYRAFIMLIASILAGSAVSVAGTIGFVGLISPHIARLFIGNDHRFLVPLSAIFGGILLTLSDTVARTIFNPVELSVGIVTSVLGAPFFLWLLFNRKSML